MGRGRGGKDEGRRCCLVFIEATFGHSLGPGAVCGITLIAGGLYSVVGGLCSVTALRKTTMRVTVYTKHRLTFGNRAAGKRPRKGHSVY
jgi:hypothetical protein